MNYQKIYDAIIDQAKKRTPNGYIEMHHIIPRCLGGTNDKSNLVALYPEEHFLCHVLLVKVYPQHKNLIIAVQKMCRPTGSRRSRKLYGWLKRKFSERMKEISLGNYNSQYGTMWINNGVVSSKVKKNSVIPEGWQRGGLKKQIEAKTCIWCLSLFTPKTKKQKCCSSLCVSSVLGSINSKRKMSDELKIKMQSGRKLWIEQNKEKFIIQQTNNSKKQTKYKIKHNNLSQV